MACREKNLDKDNQPMLVSRHVFCGQNITEYRMHEAEVGVPFSGNARFGKEAKTF